MPHPYKFPLVYVDILIFTLPNLAQELVLRVVQQRILLSHLQRGEGVIHGEILNDLLRVTLLVILGYLASRGRGPPLSSPHYTLNLSLKQSTGLQVAS